MKHLLVLSGLSLLFSTAAMAGSEGPCASFGKYGAMRAYRAEGHVANTEAKYELNHIRTKNEKSLYHVSVLETGTEVASYFVTVAASDSSCTILDVAKTNVNEF